MSSSSASTAAHSGVLAAFGRQVIKDGGFDRDIGATLSALFEQRNAADDDWLDAPEAVSEDPAADAERFVDAVEAWIDERR